MVQFVHAAELVVGNCISNFCKIFKIYTGKLEKNPVKIFINSLSNSPNALNKILHIFIQKGIS